LSAGFGVAAPARLRARARRVWLTVYIITNRRHGTLYIGVTADLESRVGQHRREWKLNLIERDNPQWLDLAAEWGQGPVARVANGRRGGGHPMVRAEWIGGTYARL
jgi:hypothetical protein